MSRFGRVRRRPDHWDSPHDRARLRVAERMAGDLRPDEATWLVEHLAGCASCAGVAAQYEADRVALRALRDAAPEPPRDLWRGPPRASSRSPDAIAAIRAARPSAALASRSAPSRPSR